MSNLSSESWASSLYAGLGGFSRGLAWIAFLLLFTNQTFAQRQDRGQKIKKSRELRMLLADVDDLRSPGFAQLSTDKQKKRLQDLRDAYQGFVPLGLEKELWTAFHQRLDLQFKLLETNAKDAKVKEASVKDSSAKSTGADAKSWQLLAVDLWQLIAQIVNLDFVPSSTSSFETGKKLFNQHCSECHGPGGNGQGLLNARLPVPATRFDGKRQIPDDTVIRYFTQISVGRQERGMPGFEDVLSQEEIWHTAFYLKALNHDCEPKLNETRAAFLKQEQKYLEAFSLRQLVFETDDWLLAKTRRLGLGDDGQNRNILRCILPFFEKIKRY